MKKLLLTIGLLVLAGNSYAGGGGGGATAAARWHAYIGSLPYFEVIKSPPSGGAAGGVTVGGSNAWSGTNSFIDANFSLLDDGDPTKIAKFQVSSIATGTTRTYTFPNATTGIAGTDTINTFTTGQIIGSNLQLFLGGSGAAFNGSIWSTAQTPDTGLLFTGTTGNSWVIAEGGDINFDFAHAAATDPTLYIQSHNQSATEWLSLNHDGTNVKFENGVNAGKFTFTTNNIARVQLGPSGVFLGTGGYVGWSSSSVPTGTINTFLQNNTAGSAGTLQMGQDVNGAPVNQTFKAHDGVTGTDRAGAKLTLGGGVGTGNAASAPVQINRANEVASGTTIQSSSQAMIVCPSRAIGTTSAVALTMATVTTTSATAGGVTMFYNTTVSDNTLLDSDTGSVSVSWNNNAGTVAATMGTTNNPVQSNASGTLASTPTVTVATNVVSFKLTPTWATIVPTGGRASVTFMVHGTGTDTIACN